MAEKRFEMMLDGVDGGPCPSCGHRGLLLSDRGVYGADRTLQHTGAGGVVRQCTVPMSAGQVDVSADGVWSFRQQECKTHSTPKEKS